MEWGTRMGSVCVYVGDTSIYSIIQLLIQWESNGREFTQPHTICGDSLHFTGP